jgi:hypothetical protein
MDAGAGEASKWKKKSEALFRLDNPQEEASNHVSSAMAAFVQRTSLVKEVCTPSSLERHGRFLDSIRYGASRVTSVSFLISTALERW